MIDYIEGPTSIWEKEPLQRLAHEGQLMAYQHPGFWQPMDTLRDKTTSKISGAKAKRPWRIWP